MRATRKTQSFQFLEIPAERSAFHGLAFDFTGFGPDIPHTPARSFGGEEACDYSVEVHLCSIWLL